MKILNIRHIHEQKFGKLDPGTGKPLVPTQRTMRLAYDAASDAGIHLGGDGRAYAPWKSNVAGMRWEKGKLVPRKRA